MSGRSPGVDRGPMEVNAGADSFDNGERHKGNNNKVRITIHLDRDVISYFKNKSARTAKRYQTLINDALRDHAGLVNQPHRISDLTERVKRLEQELFKRPSN